MPFVQVLLLHIPAFLLCFIIIFIYIAISIAGLYIIRLFHSPEKLKIHNDVAGSIFATLGVTYAVLLAFLVVTTWKDFSNAQKNVSQEANAIASLYRDTSPLPTAFRSKFKSTLENYVNTIINDEWPVMAEGKSSAKVEQEQNKIWQLLRDSQPKSEIQKIFFTEAVKKLNELGEMRQARILQAEAGLHPFLYFVLLVGGLITITFTLFFGTENFVLQAIMTSLLAMMIAIIFFTIMVLDFPFTGDISIKADALKSVLANLIRLP